MNNKKGLSLLLTFVLIATLIPSTAFASEVVPEEVCTHVHSDACNSEVDVCNHIHDEHCGGLLTLDPSDSNDEIDVLETDEQVLSSVLPETTVATQNDDPETVAPLNWQDIEYEGIRYLLSEDEASVMGWVEDGDQPTITIPATISYGGNEYRVTSIETYVFWGTTSTVLDMSGAYNLETIFAGAFCQSNLASVHFPSSGSLEIRSEAFWGCNNLVSVTIPSSVSRIDGQAFFNCNSLASLDLSSASNLTKIGDGAFLSCKALESVDFSGATKLHSINDFAFERTGITGTLTLPSNLVNIGIKAFYTTNISGTLILPSSLKTIGSSAFHSTGISGPLVLPSSLTSIGAGAFHSTGISGTITIPAGIAQIEDEVFASAGGITSLILHENIISIGVNAFSRTSISGPLVLPSALTSIGEGAFRLTSISGNLTIPSGVTRIEKETFSGAGSITSLTLPEGLLSIGNGAFSETGISGVLTIPSSVTTIEDNAFRGCSAITSLAFPGTGSLDIGSRAFQGSGLTGTLTLPANVKSVGIEAFSNTRISGTLVLPASLDSVGAFAFAKTNLIAADLRAFRGTLGAGVFASGSFASLSFSENPAPVYQRGAFSEMPATGTVYYPAGATGYTKEAFGHGYLNTWTFTPYTAQERSFTAVQVGGASGTTTSTGIKITFNGPVENLTASHVRVENDTGVVNVGALSGADSTWTMNLSTIKKEGNVKVSVSNFSAYTVSTTTQTVAVYRETNGPSAPQGLRVGIGNHLLTLSWRAPLDDGGIPITQYQVSKDGGSTWSDADSSTGHTFGDLENGTVYDCAVRAVNASFEGTAAFIKGTPIGPPNAPTNVILTPGDGKLNIKWTMPTSGGSPITGWEISVSAGGDNWMPLPFPWVTETNKEGLTNGVEYTVKVRAVSVLGTGTASTPVTATPAGVPHMPVLLTATPSDGQIQLNWTTPGNGGSALIKYQIMVFDGNVVGRWEDIPSSGPSTTSYLLTGLTNGTRYFLSVRAVNAMGEGAGASALGIPSSVIVAPSVPRNLVAVPADAQVTLSWQEPSNNGGGIITNYEVSKDGGTSWVNAGAVSAYSFTGLDNGTTYDFCVRAVNSAGSGDEATASSTPATTASAPQKLTTAPGDSQIVLSWSAPLSNGGSSIKRYEVSQDGINWVAANGTLEHTFSGLVNGTNYTLWVRALNGMGEGAGASVVSKPLASPMVPGAPQNLKVTPGDGKLGLSWDPPASNNGSAIIKYQYSVSTGAEVWMDVPLGIITSIGVGSLDNGTSYTVKVRAVNLKGPGWPVQGSGTPIATTSVPAAPTNFSVTVGNGQLLLSWTTPSDGGSAITGYQVSASKDGSENWQTIDGSGPNTTTHMLTGLINDTNYTLKVRAVNSRGVGAEAVGFGTPVPGFSPPDAPVNLKVTPGDTELMLSWTTPSDGGSAIIYYLVSVTTDGPDDWQVIVGSGPATVSHLLTGLINGTSYTVQLRALNGRGRGEISSVKGTPQEPAPALSFTHESAYDIPASMVGVAVSSIDVSGGVSGGTPPYTFAANGLPAGIVISTAGVLSGTPTTEQAAGIATITVTDDVDSAARINISFGAVSVLPKEATPNAIFDGAVMQLKDVTAAMKYSVDGGATFITCNATTVDLSEALVSTANGICVVQPGNGSTTVDSDTQIITLTQAIAPAGVDKTDETAAGKNDGTLTGVSALMEYRLSGAGSWIGITGDKVTDLAPGTYTVRSKGGSNMLASTAVSLTVAAYSAPEPIYTLRTLKHEDTGVIVKVKAAPDTILVVKPNILHTEGACAACDSIRRSPNRIALYDISLQGGYSGTIEVSIPVPDSYNGKNILVRHCQDSHVEEVELTVQNGYATGVFSSLSPFAVFSIDRTHGNSDSNSDGNNDGSTALPRTGDTRLILACLGLMVSALLVTGFARRRSESLHIP